MLKHIILGIITPLFELLSLNYKFHISILNNVFNTNIFQNPTKEIYLIGITIAILLKINNKYKNTKITKKNLKLLKNKLKYLLLTPVIFLPNINNSLYIFLIPIIILLINKNNNTNNNLSTKKIILINLINILTILNIPLLLSTLLACKINKLSKKESIKISLFLYIIYNIKEIIINPTPLDINSLMGIIISFILTFNFFNTFINLYKSNKLYKLTIYQIFIIIFNLYWFR